MSTQHNHKSTDDQIANLQPRNGCHEKELNSLSRRTSRHALLKLLQEHKEQTLQAPPVQSVQQYQEQCGGNGVVTMHGDRTTKQETPNNSPPCSRDYLVAIATFLDIILISGILIYYYYY